MTTQSSPPAAAAAAAAGLRISRHYNNFLSYITRLLPPNYLFTRRQLFTCCLSTRSILADVLVDTVRGGLEEEKVTASPHHPLLSNVLIHHLIIDDQLPSPAITS